MSATQTIADLFDRFCDGFGICMAERFDSKTDSCAECPLFAVADDAGSCKDAFAELLKQSKGEPWEARADRIGSKGFCSLCGCWVPDGRGECPSCKAAIR